MDYPIESKNVSLSSNGSALDKCPFFLETPNFPRSISNNNSMNESNLTVPSKMSKNLSMKDSIVNKNEHRKENRNISLMQTQDFVEPHLIRDAQTHCEEMLASPTPSQKNVPGSNLQQRSFQQPLIDRQLHPQNISSKNQLLHDHHHVFQACKMTWNANTMKQKVVSQVKQNTYPQKVTKCESQNFRASRNKDKRKESLKFHSSESNSQAKVLHPMSSSLALDHSVWQQNPSTNPLHPNHYRISLRNYALQQLQEIYKAHKDGILNNLRVQQLVSELFEKCEDAFSIHLQQVEWLDQSDICFSLKHRCQILTHLMQNISNYDKSHKISINSSGSIIKETQTEKKFLQPFLDATSTLESQIGTQDLPYKTPEVTGIRNIFYDLIDSPYFVNPKQYNRILKRREQRKKQYKRLMLSINSTDTSKKKAAMNTQRSQSYQHPHLINSGAIPHAPFGNFHGHSPNYVQELNPHTVKGLGASPNLMSPNSSSVVQISHVKAKIPQLHFPSPRNKASAPTPLQNGFQQFSQPQNPIFVSSSDTENRPNNFISGQAIPPMVTSTWRPITATVSLSPISQHKNVIPAVLPTKRTSSDAQLHEPPLHLSPRSRDK